MVPRITPTRPVVSTSSHSIAVVVEMRGPAGSGPRRPRSPISADSTWRRAWHRSTGPRCRRAPASTGSRRAARTIYCRVRRCAPETVPMNKPTAATISAAATTAAPDGTASPPKRALTMPPPTATRTRKKAPEQLETGAALELLSRSRTRPSPNSAAPWIAARRRHAGRHPADRDPKAWLAHLVGRSSRTPPPAIRNVHTCRRQPSGTPVVPGATSPESSRRTAMSSPLDGGGSGPEVGRPGK